MHEALLSLFHSDFGISYIRFRMTRQANSKGKVVKAPLVVHKYNQTMGGVDLVTNVSLSMTTSLGVLNYGRRFYSTFS